jgi:hypothetical protein
VTKRPDLSTKRPDLSFWWLFPIRSGEICRGGRGRRRKRKEKENGLCFTAADGGLTTLQGGGTWMVLMEEKDMGSISIDKRERRRKEKYK